MPSTEHKSVAQLIVERDYERRPIPGQLTLFDRNQYVGSLEWLRSMVNRYGHCGQ